MKHSISLLVAALLCAIQAQAADSLNCRLIGQLANRGGMHYGAFQFAVVDTLAFLPAQDSGLDIVDVSNPANMSIIGNFSTTGKIDAVCVDGSYAYACGSGYLRVVDINDPTHPTAVGNCALNGAPLYAVKDGDYVYCSNWAGGLQIVDVSAPSSPTPTGSSPANGAIDVTVIGDYAYVATADVGAGSMRTVDVSNKSNPTEIGLVSLYLAEGIHAFGPNHVYVSDGSWQRVFDVSDSDTAIQVGNYDNTGYAYRVDILGDFAYVATTAGLQVFDVSDTTSMTRVGYYSADGADAKGVVRSGPYVYVADYSAGLQVIEFSGDTAGHGGDEGRRLPAGSSHLAATVVRGVLLLTGDGRRETGNPAALLDAAGRRVMELQPGPNDVRHFSPGVYFVSSPRTMEKVLLAR